MQKKYYLFLLISLTLLISCGTPNEPESIIGGDGGYKVMSKLVTSGYAQDVVVNDTLAFVAQSEGGLMIINISDRKAAKELSTVSQGLKGSAYKVIRKDSVIYIAAGGFGLSVVDVANPLQPEITETNMNVKPCRSMDILGNFLICANAEHGFKIAEIGGFPTHPDLRGETVTPGLAQSVCVTPDDNYLLVACGEMGVALFNISELVNGWGTYPILGWVDTQGYAEDVVAHPTLPYAFLACGPGGLYIVDYSDSSDLKIIGSYNTGGYAKEVFYQNNKVYVTTELRGLQIIDVSNINSPVRIGTVETSYALGLTADDKYIYVTDENEGLVIISIP